MELKPYTLKFSQAIDELPTAIAEKFRIVAGNDLKEMIKLRVQTGEDSEGGGFKPYAPLTVEIRQNKGMQTSFKDFTFTGEMWRKFGEKSFTATKNNASITLGGTNADAEMKINDNTEREGKNIIEPSDEEIKYVEDFLIEEIDNYLSSL